MLRTGNLSRAGTSDPRWSSKPSVSEPKRLNRPHRSGGSPRHGRADPAPGVAWRLRPLRVALSRKRPFVVQSGHACQDLGALRPPPCLRARAAHKPPNVLRSRRFSRSAAGQRPRAPDCPERARIRRWPPARRESAPTRPCRCLPPAACGRIIRRAIPGGPPTRQEAKCMKFRYSRLAGNELTGAVPPALGRLAPWERLDPGGNRRTGSIPAELGQLEDLRDNHGQFPVEP